MTEHRSALRLCFDADVAIQDIPEGLTDQSQKTVIVTGMSRGGTSAISSVIEALGVYMGPTSSLVKGGAFEWDVFSAAVHPEEIVAVVAETNAKRDVWGCKCAGTPERFLEFIGSFRNPYVILSVRDAVAAATFYARAEAIKASQWERLREYHRGFGDFLDIFAVAATYPRMAISYERAMNQPYQTVIAIIKFLHLSPDCEQVLEAAGRLRARGGYLRTVNQGQSVDIEIENNPFHYRK